LPYVGGIMFTQAKACKYIQPATLPLSGSIPAQLTKPEKSISAISFKKYEEAHLRTLITGPNGNGGLPGLTLSAGQLAGLPENYVVSYHNHLIHGHDLPEGLFPIRGGDTLVNHQYAIGAYAVLSKLLLAMTRAKSKSLNPEDKKDANDYFWWYKRCDYHLKQCIKLYPTTAPTDVVLGGVVYEAYGTETYEMLYDIDRFNAWKTNSLGNTLPALLAYWVANKTQPPAIII
jgi:hypothetical protein